MKIAIFNGFKFHYETFGVFLYTLQKCGHTVTVFTNRGFETGWFGFYYNFFGDFFSTKFYTDFTEEEFNNHDFVIVTTDDDGHFNEHFLTLPGGRNKVLAYDHHHTLRRPAIKHHVGTRPFTSVGRPELPYMYACYPITSFSEKLECFTKNEKIIITLIGGPANIDKYFNYLKVNNDLSNVKFYFIRRWITDEIRKTLDSFDINYECLIGIDTQHMFDILKHSQYVMFTDDGEHTFNSSSGAIGLALSTGCTMLMPRVYNTDYKFKNAIYFEDCPVLVKEPSLDVIFKERDEIINDSINTLNTFLLGASSEST